MNISNSTHCDKVNTVAHILSIVFYSLLFLVGLLLNGIILNFYFCRARQQKTSSVTVYLKNLAAADFLISLCLPLRILNHASNSNWVYCNFGSPVFYLNMYASILFMGYIAANRYLKIVNPRGTLVFRTVRAAHVTSTVTWVILITMMSAYTLLSLLTQEVPSVPFGMSCDVLQSKQLKLFYKIIHIICATIFLLILLSLVFFYYSTCRMLSLAQQRQPASSSSKKLTKSRRNMLVLVSVFCVCFIPYHLVRLPYAFLSKQFMCSQLFFYLKELTIMVSVLNICLDPLIYFMFCKAFRTQLRASKSSFRTTQDMTQVERRCSAGWMTVRMKTDTCDL